MKRTLAAMSRDVLGGGGVQQMLDPPMTADERAPLENSATSLREAGRRILAVTQ
jgi:hypothetical protein